MLIRMSPSQHLLDASALQSLHLYYWRFVLEQHVALTQL